MHVSIKYPDEFPLKGWNKGIFGLRVAGMFRSKYIDICALDACRKQLKLDEDHESQLQADLRELHCVNFRKIPQEVLEELPSKVSEYIGVEVRRSFRLPLITIAGWLAIGLVLAGLAWVVFTIVKDIEARQNERISRATLDQIIPYTNDQQPAIKLASSGADSESSKILAASITTSSPAKTIHQLANVITESGKKFDVVVTVTRSDD